MVLEEQVIEDNLALALALALKAFSFFSLEKKTLAGVANMVISCYRISLGLFLTLKVRKLFFQCFQSTPDKKIPYPGDKASLDRC